MQHPDFTSQLARERQSRYRAEGGWSRLTRLDRNGDGDNRKPSFGRVTVARRAAVLREVAR